MMSGIYFYILTESILLIVNVVVLAQFDEVLLE
jgi:hypothetical protein